MNKIEATPLLPACSIGEFDGIWEPPQNPLADLKVRWDMLWGRLELNERSGLFETMIARWSESSRAYHTPRHLLECLKVVDMMESYCAHPDLVKFSMWYHDIIYSANQNDNEGRSAQLARATFVKSAGSVEMAEVVQKIVLATSHHHPVNTVDEAVAVDADLAILGSPKARFDEYDRQIRKEYKHIANEEFIDGRAHIFEAFLSRRVIYRSPLLHALAEQRARENLTAGVGRLNQKKRRLARGLGK